MRKALQTLWRALTAPLRLIAWPFRALREFLNYEPEETSTADEFSRAFEDAAVLLEHLHALRAPPAVQRLGSLRLHEPRPQAQRTRVGPVLGAHGLPAVRGRSGLHLLHCASRRPGLPAQLHGHPYYPTPLQLHPPP